MSMSIAVSVLILLLYAYVSIGLYYATIGSIKRLAENARTIATGDLDVRVDLGTRDELKLVGDSLNEMVRSLSRPDPEGPPWRQRSARGDQESLPDRQRTSIAAASSRAMPLRPWRRRSKR
jgi:HAMP domain-containing protein